MPPAPAAPPAAAPAAAPKAPVSAPAPAAAPKAPAKAAGAAPSAPPDKGGDEPSFMGEYAAEIEKMAGEELHPMPPKDRKKNKEQAAAAAKGEVKPPEGEAPAGKADEQPGAPAGDTPPAEPTSVPEIRKAYTALKKKTAEEYEPKIQALEARVKELESTNPTEVKTLQSRLEAAEKRRDELENEIRFTDYSKSTEFQEKYQKPYHQAWAKALHEITQLNRTTEDGGTRKATQDDILALANAPLDQLDKLAEEWFPTSSARVIRHVEKIKDLSEAQSEALERARTEGAERAKTSDLERKTQQEATVKKLETMHDSIVKQWPKMFGEVEGDAEGNALLQKGETMYQKAFNPTDKNKPASEEEAIQLHALIRNKVRNHDRLAMWLKQARSQIAELEKALAEYEGSSPNGGLDKGGGKSGGGIVDELTSGLKELEEMEKRSGR